MLEEADIRERVRAEISAKRFNHTEGVVSSATTLAIRFGVDVQRARLAALIHDFAREWPADKLLAYAENVEVPSGFASIPGLLHGPIVAAFADEWFGIQDEDLCNAVRYHTTGRIGMSRLERVIYLADAIEPGRQYPGVDELRGVAEQDLLQAVVLTMDGTIRHLIDAHLPVFPLTVMARNDLWDEVRQAEIGGN